MQRLKLTLFLLFSLTHLVQAQEEIRAPENSEMKAKAGSAIQALDFTTPNKTVNEAVQQAMKNAKTTEPLLAIPGTNNQPQNKFVKPPLETIDGQVYVFISQSMPMKTLQTYARTISRLGHGVMVMNGFIGDPQKIKPSLQFMQEIRKKDPLCEGQSCTLYPIEIQINPILFQQYAIQRVPAFVWESKPKDKYCDVDLNKLPQYGGLVLEGDADLIYVLNEMLRHTSSPQIAQIIKDYES